MHQNVRRPSTPVRHLVRALTLHLKLNGFVPSLTWDVALLQVKYLAVEFCLESVPQIIIQVRGRPVSV